MLVLTPQTAVAAHTATMRVAAPNAFTVYSGALNPSFSAVLSFSSILPTSEEDPNPKLGLAPGVRREPNKGVFPLLLGGGHRLSFNEDDAFGSGVNREVTLDVSPILRGGRETESVLDCCLRSKTMGTAKAAVVIKSYSMWFR